VLTLCRAADETDEDIYSNQAYLILDDLTAALCNNGVNSWWVPAPACPGFIDGRWMKLSQLS